MSIKDSIEGYLVKKQLGSAFRSGGGYREQHKKEAREPSLYGAVLSVDESHGLEVTFNLKRYPHVGALISERFPNAEYSPETEQGRLLTVSLLGFDRPEFREEYEAHKQAKSTHR